MLRLSVILACAGAVALAQTTTTTPAPAAAPGNPARGQGVFPVGRGPGGRGLDLMGPRSEQRLSQQLALDSTQQNTLHQALASEQVQRKGLNEKAAGLRTQLAAAVRSGNEGAINSITSDLSAVQQQTAAAHAKTLSTFYNSLNATQRAKVEPMLNRELGIATPRTGGPGRGPGGRGPRQAPAAAPAQTQQ